MAAGDVLPSGVGGCRGKGGGRCGLVGGQVALLGGVCVRGCPSGGVGPVEPHWQSESRERWEGVATGGFEAAVDLVSSGRSQHCHGPA